MCAVVAAGNPALAQPAALPSPDEPLRPVDSYDKTLGMKGWAIPFPSFGDSIVQDAGGVRSALAKYGLGFEVISVSFFYENLLDHPHVSADDQVYAGQRPTTSSGHVAYVMADLSRYGIPDGQFVIAGSIARSSWQPAEPDSLSMVNLTYYQTFLDKALELKVGYQANGEAFVGAFQVGTNIANGLFGPAMPSELGMSDIPAPAPGINLTYNVNSEVYDKFGIQRSISPTANMFVDDKQKNGSGFRFTEPGAGILFINEFGFNRSASATEPKTAVRAGVMYNTSQYHNYKTNGTSTNFGFYALADRQVWQFDPVGTAYRGVYVGASVMYAAPQTSISTWYFEGRVYGIGLMYSRPDDLVGFVINHSRFSPYVRDRLMIPGAPAGLRVLDDSSSLTFSYSAKVRRGVYVEPALSYTDHQSLSTTSAKDHTLNAQVSLTLLF